jgi:hypothetical protein
MFSSLEGAAGSQEKELGILHGLIDTLHARRNMSFGRPMVCEYQGRNKKCISNNTG